MRVATIRPGLLVALNTSVQGNVKYIRQDIETTHRTEEGTLKAKWETERTVNDPEEFNRATDVRNKARGIIAAVCSPCSFGLLCPNTRADDLAQAIETAQQMARDFNASATQTRVTIAALSGRIAQDDAEAMRAISNEVSDLLDRMEAGVRALDVEAIRDAAKRAKSIAGMVSDDANERLQQAIDAARMAARKIVKAGETAATEIDEATLRSISTARTAFLDLDAPKPVEAPTVTGRALDLETAPSAPAEIKASAATLDLF